LAKRGVKFLSLEPEWLLICGVAAANTIIPVIGVPIDSSPLSAWILSWQQFRCRWNSCGNYGYRKAGAYNAAIFAVQILSYILPGLGEEFIALKRNG